MRENDVTPSNDMEMKNWRHQTNQNGATLVSAVICCNNSLQFSIACIGALC